jgi:predicted ATPase
VVSGRIRRESPQIHGAAGDGFFGFGKDGAASRDCQAIRETWPDALVLFGGCEEQEQVAYKAFSAVLEELGRWLVSLPREECLLLVPRHASILARVFPQLAQLSRLESETGVHVLTHSDPGEARQIAFSALRELLGRIADRRRVVMLLDDVQWADEDSLRLLGSLVQSPGAPALLLCMALRTHMAGLAAVQLPWLEELLPELNTIRLRPLSMETSLALIRGLLQANPEFKEWIRRWLRALAVKPAGSHCSSMNCSNICGWWGIPRKPHFGSKACCGRASTFWRMISSPCWNWCAFRLAPCG